MTAQDARIPCPRCLAREVPGGEALAALLEQWIEAIPEARRADGEARRARLAACRACPHLGAATCALCGCYVEYRAAHAAQRCPDIPDRWASFTPLTDR